MLSSSSFFVLVLYLYTHFPSLQMLFSVLKHCLDLYISGTALKVSQTCTVSLFLYIMVLKTFFPGCGVWASLLLFLIMSSLCGVVIHVCRVNNYSSKTRMPRDMLFFLKIPYLLRIKNCSKHANLFVRLFARVITSEVLPPKCENYNTLS